MEHTKCYCCPAEATLLCDSPVLGPDGFYSVEAGLCSRPMCEAHAVTVGLNFDLSGPGQVDSHDYCFPCAKEDGREPPPPALRPVA